MGGRPLKAASFLPFLFVITLAFTRSITRTNRYIVYEAATVLADSAITGSFDFMIDVRTLAAKVLAFLHEQEERRGQLNVPIATLYKTFEKEATYETVQQAIRFLVDRDLIAAFSYSLTAKGRREHGLSKKT